MARCALHIAWILGCSIIAFLIWCAATGIALSPIINRSDEGPRTEAAFTGFERFCGFISNGMAYPFLWIPPRVLNDAEAIILFAGFWGNILYLFLWSAVWFVRRIVFQSK
jgi:hypothetical protein